MQLAEDGGEDMEYDEILHAVENDTTNLSENRELSRTFKQQ